MNNAGIKIERVVTWILGVCMFVLCPLVCPKIGELQNSYMQLGLFACILYSYIIYRFIFKEKASLSIRISDISILLVACLYLVHVLFIVPSTLTVWWWIRFVCCIGTYIFVRLQSPTRIKKLFMLFFISGCIQCIYAILQKVYLLTPLNSSFDMTSIMIKTVPLIVLDANIVLFTLYFK